MTLRILRAAMLVAAVLPAAAGAVPDKPLVETRDCLDPRFMVGERSTRGGDYYVRIGRDWWHNTARGCPFAPGRTIIWRSPMTRQCRGDIVDVIDARSGIGFGGCALGNWEKVPAPPADAKG